MVDSKNVVDLGNFFCLFFFFVVEDGRRDWEGD